MENVFSPSGTFSGDGCSLKMFILKYDFPTRSVLLVYTHRVLVVVLENSELYYEVLFSTILVLQSVFRAVHG